MTVLGMFERVPPVTSRRQWMCDSDRMQVDLQPTSPKRYPSEYKLRDLLRECAWLPATQIFSAGILTSDREDEGECKT